MQGSKIIKPGHFQVEPSSFSHRLPVVVVVVVDGGDSGDGITTVLASEVICVVVVQRW